MTIRRGEGRRDCEICGAAGELRYARVGDHVHQIAGDWSYRQCRNPRCGLLWLDPPIVEADLPRLYADYFTHGSTVDKRESGRRRWVVRVRDAYLRDQYGRDGILSREEGRFLAAAAYLVPLRRMKLDAAYMYLKRRGGSAGRLLDVGCGNGERLQRLTTCGWTGIGIDFDARAIDECRRNGLDVRLGTLEGQRFEAESFDAIVLNHVIEHVAHPAALLAECLRLARPGARLVMVTPNSRSALHRVFGRYWRGLEAPRHLRVFSGWNLARMSTDSGWKVERAFTSLQMTDVMFVQSWSSLITGSSNASGLVLRWVGTAVQSALAAIAWARPTIGEEVVLELIKPVGAGSALPAPMSP